MAGVALGHGDDETEVGLEEVGLGRLAVDGQGLVVTLAGSGQARLLLSGTAQTGLDPLGQLDLLLGVSSAVLPMVLRYTRTRSVDTRPVVSLLASR